MNMNMFRKRSLSLLMGNNDFLNILTFQIVVGKVGFIFHGLKASLGVCAGKKKNLRQKSNFLQFLL